MAKNKQSLFARLWARLRPKLRMPLAVFWQEHRWWRRFAKLCMWIAGLIVLANLLNTFVFLPIKDPDYGVSFSQKRSVELGLNWKENYLALLDDLGFKRLRLMSYWDLGEPTRGQFSFADLDWQMDEAAKRGVKVALATGLRQPRWPECHQPMWADKLSGHDWKQALYAYMEVVTNRYREHPALDTWQLENEGMNNWFGTCDPPDRERLIEEFNLVKSWDPDHRVAMSLSDQHGYPVFGPIPDEFGFSVYRIVWNDKFPPNGYMYYPTPIWYHRLRAAIITAVHQRPTFVHELQMEPWGYKDTRFLTNEEQDKSMSIEQIPRVFMFARQIGMQRIDLWGGEWWYWRKMHGDPRIWETVRWQLQQTPIVM